ncbi:MAG TPA: MAPEG family protein [Bradyrhizobium sp.]|uniref:MAPEG family protein n=1 Tax=Bradyrhizobium sp. TaxID=376 RepID=UPI002D7F60DA|nr:MAPEG family protein [Bradyrhizobium sp.]HET7885138.1 MAPEG family protein [Bradyrhizobium sp.]
MSVQWVLLPLFVQVGLTFALLFGIGARRSAAANREAGISDIARNQFELPLLFYALIAIALPIRHADLVIVMLSWVFVVCRVAHAGVFVSSNDGNRRWMAWLSSALVLLAMWVYFALKILLLI